MSYSQPFSFLITHEWASKARVFILLVGLSNRRLMISSKVGAYPSEAPLAPDLTHKQNRLKRPPRVNHSGL
jgi:hypothetical protein